MAPEFDSAISEGVDAPGAIVSGKLNVCWEATRTAKPLLSVTGGQGSYTMDFSHYDAMPGNVQAEIISKAKLHEEEEE